MLFSPASVCSGTDKNVDIGSLAVKIRLARLLLCVGAYYETHFRPACGQSIFSNYTNQL